MEQRTLYNNAKMLINSDEVKEQNGEKFNSKNLVLKGQGFIELKKKEKSKSQPEETTAERVKSRKQKGDDKDKNLFETSSHFADNDSDKFNDIPDMPPLESAKNEVKESKALKILTPNKLLVTLFIKFIQIKKKLLYHQHNKITKKFYNNIMKSF